MRFVVILLPVLLLSGCSVLQSKPKVEEKVVIKYMMPTIPVGLMDRCNVTPPPDKKTYVSKPPVERERMLTTLIIHLYRDIKTCNDKLDAVKFWYETQRKGLKDED